MSAEPTLLIEASQQATSPEGIAALGINGKIFLAQLFHFLIVLGIFWKWVWNPLRTTMEKREKTLEQGLHDAKEAGEKLQALEQTSAHLLREAKEQAQAMMQEAQAKAEAHRVSLLEKTKKEVAEVVEAGKKTLEQERLASVQSFREDIATLVTAAAAKVIEQEVSEKSSEKAVETLLKKTV